MSKAIAVLIASSVGVAGCAAPMSMKGGGRGWQQSCDIPVSVDSAASPDRDHVKVGKKNQWICWSLDDAAAQSYVFHADSIAIADQKGDAFKNCKTGENNGNLDPDGRQIACHDINPYPASYKYTIKLYDKSGQAGPSKDPSIDNY